MSILIVTTKGQDGQPWALTATAFSSVSADPPLCLVCVHKDARIAQPLHKNGVFAVNLLADDQQPVSETCASGALDRFQNINWSEGQVTGCPLISDALSTVECTVEEIHSGGDHDIIVGRVRSAHARNGSPLVYWRGSYSSLSEPPMSGTNQDSIVPPLVSDIRGLLPLEKVGSDG
jgi:3-hydroxy-9,10-secoandrosta-1,3,5(10)-triene-9,17-dione monooxygenase reductase component